MLAIGRILRTGARLLLLDEPTEGLAPVIIQQIGRTILALKEQALRSFWWSRTSGSPPPLPPLLCNGARPRGRRLSAPSGSNLDKLHEYLEV
jgi:branched-chain amino acid transport system ATP-binding protein